jgi:hypothetical protein
MLSNNGFAKMHVDQSGGGKLCLVVGECGVKRPLMVVVSILQSVIFTANIDNSVAGLQHGWVSSADEGSRRVLWKETKHVHCEGFICVEVTIMSSNQGRIRLEPLRRYFCSHFGQSTEHAQDSREAMVMRRISSDEAFKNI